MSSLVMIGLGVAIYLVVTIKYVKMEKLEKRAKAKKSK